MNWRPIVTTGQDDIFMVSRAGMTIRFSEADVRAMGRDAAGVRGMAARRRRGRGRRHCAPVLVTASGPSCTSSIGKTGAD